MRQTTVPYREWPWRQRVIEKLYRLFHHGQIRTIVVRERRFDGDTLSGLLDFLREHGAFDPAEPEPEPEPAAEPEFPVTAEVLRAYAFLELITQLVMPRKRR